MEREKVQLVDDNCSQIEVAFKRMKVGTRRCVDGANHRHIYNRSNHYHNHNQHSVQQLNHSDQQQPNQIVKHHPDQLQANGIPSTTTRVNPYYNQMFNTTSTRVIPKTPDDETHDKLASTDGKDSTSFSSFSVSPLASSNSFLFTKTNISPSSSSSAPSLGSLSSAVTPLLDSSSSMGPYRDVVLHKGQTDTFNHQHRHPENQIQNDNNHQLQHLNQSNDNIKFEDGPPVDPDVSVEELAAYLDVQLYIPRKMSYMAELMYT